MLIKAVDWIGSTTYLSVEFHTITASMVSYRLQSTGFELERCSLVRAIIHAGLRLHTSNTSSSGGGDGGSQRARADDVIT